MGFDHYATFFYGIHYIGVGLYDLWESLADLERKWKAAVDPICAGIVTEIINGEEQLAGYLAIRATHHRVENPIIDSFNFPPIQKAKWDRLLREKYAELIREWKESGIDDKALKCESKGPAFHLIAEKIG